MVAPTDSGDNLAVVPWFWRDWRASTARAVLSPLARGIYRELLDALYGQPDCSLPSDDRQLAALAGCQLRTWTRVSRDVLGFFDLGSDGRLRNRRATKVWTEAVAKRESYRAGGRATAAKRWDSPATARQGAEQPHSSSSPTPTPYPESEKKKKQRDRSDAAPDGALVSHPLLEAWNRAAEGTRLHKATTLGTARRRHADKRLTEADAPTWERAYQLIAADPFCRGENDRGWVADFDYALRPEKSGKWLDRARSDAKPPETPLDRALRILGT